MTGWLIYDRRQYDINRWFADELMKYCAAFSEMKLIIVEKLKYGVSDAEPLYFYEDKPVVRPDFAIVRTIFPLLSAFLEQDGVRVINRAAISKICNDKRLTYMTAAASGIPILPTLFFDRRFLDARQAASVSYPCIAKSANGHGGQEVSMIWNDAELLSFVNGIASNDFLIQKVCPTTGKDLRVYVLGEKIIGAVLRSSDGIKSNYSLGGTAAYYDLNSEEEEKAYRILKCLPCKADFIGIDFLLDHHDLVFNEIEDVVGSRMLYAAADMDAARMFADHISRTI